MTLYTSSGTNTYDDDTYLSGGATTSNYGGSGTIYCGTAGTPGECRSLLRFDLTHGTNPIAVTDIVSAGSVTINCVGYGGARTVAIYQCLQPWTESEATWQKYDASNNWVTAGAKNASDYNSTVLGSVGITGTGPFSIPLTGDGIGVVNGWVINPSSNNGFLLATTTMGDLEKFASIEYTTVNDRPYLTLEYSSGGGAGYTLILNTT